MKPEIQITLFTLFILFIVFCLWQEEKQKCWLRTHLPSLLPPAPGRMSEVELLEKLGKTNMWFNGGPTFRKMMFDLTTEGLIELHRTKDPDMQRGVATWYCLPSPA